MGFTANSQADLHLNPFLYATSYLWICRMQSRLSSLNFCAKDFYSDFSEKHEISINWCCLASLQFTVLQNVRKSAFFHLVHCRLRHKKKLWLSWRKCSHIHSSVETNYSTRWKPLYLWDGSFIKRPSFLCQSVLIKPHIYVLIVAVKSERSFLRWCASRKVFLFEALYFLYKKKNSEKSIVVGETREGGRERDGFCVSSINTYETDIMPFFLDFHLHAQKRTQRAKEYVRKFQERLSTTPSQNIPRSLIQPIKGKTKKWFVSSSYMKFLCQICTFSTSRVGLINTLRGVSKKKLVKDGKCQAEACLYQISFKLMTQWNLMSCNCLFSNS